MAQSYNQEQQHVETNNDDAEETEMLGTVFRMRVRVLRMVTDVCVKKFGDTQNATKSKIDIFLETAETEFDKADSLKANTFLEQAESLYSDFDKYLEDENSKRTHSENKETSNNTNYDHVVVPNIVSHKVTVRGDSHDVSRCIRLAGTALASGDLIKAERLLLKAERICPTTNARELLKQVEEAKRATEASVSTAPVPPSPPIVQEPPEKAKENISERNKCLDVARDAIQNKNFDKAERFLLKAKRFDPELDVKDMLDIVQSALLKQTMVDNYISIAREAITEMNYDKANDFLIKACSTDSNVRQRIQDMWKIVQNGLHNKSTAKRCLETANKYIAMKQFKSAEIFLMKAYEADPTIDIKELLSIINAGLVKENEITSLINNARKAIDDKEYKTADEVLDRIKIIDPEVDIKDLKVRVQVGIASISSTDDDFVIINDVRDVRKNDPKRYSEECVNKAVEALKRSDAVTAETWLNKAISYYNSMRCDELLKQVEALKKSQNQIPEPSFVNSNSETKFAYDRELNTPRVFSSYNSKSEISEEDKNEAEKYLTKGQNALTCGDFEKAEEFALKSQKLWPTVRVQGLIEDIHDKMKNVKVYDAGTLRSGSVYKPKNYDQDAGTQTDTDLKKQAEQCLEASEKALSEGKLDEAEDLLRTAESLHPVEGISKLFDKISKAYTQKQEADELEMYNTWSRMHQYQTTPPSELSSDTNKEEALKCVKKAEEAFIQKDLDKAERWIQKASRMATSEKIDFFLEKIEAEKNRKKIAAVYSQPGRSTEPQVHNKKDAKKCIAVAKDAISEGDLNKAKHFLEKSNRLYPSNKVQDMIKKMQSTKGETVDTFVNITDDEDDDNINKATSSSNDKLEQVQRLINQAMDAMNNEAYYLAEILLDKANLIKKTPQASELLQSVRSIIKDKIAGMPYKRDSSKKKEAEKLLNMAQKKLHARDFANAQSLALISESFHPMSQNRKMIQLIVDERYKDEKDKQFERSTGKNKKGKTSAFEQMEELNKFKSERYIEMAECAWDFGNFQLAEDYLNKSLDLCPTFKAKQMIADVRAAKGSGNNVVLRFFSKVNDFIFN